MNRITAVICYLFLLLIWTACAIQVPPGGGDKDVIPPSIVKSEPENYSTGFSGNEIAITFDEYIQLKDVNSQLIISPPLKNFPEVKIRKKTLYINFEDTLESNTTYSFSFGNSIVDNNEGNALENYQYVISTGMIIDSLEISGMIENASDRKTEKDILVMLYKGSDDSLPFLKRPYYFGRTNEAGKFRVRNISPGAYKVIGLKDINKDYLFNPPEEHIAFADSRILDGSSDLVLRMFREEETFKLLRAYSEEPGKVICAFNGAADTLSLNWITDTASLKFYSMSYSSKKDTITIWYRNQEADTLQINFPELSNPDTLTIRLLKKDVRFSSRNKTALLTTPSSGSGYFQDIHRPFDIVFNHPIESGNISGIHFTEDSLSIPPDSFRFVDSLHTRLRYTGTWKPRTTYNFRIPSGQFRDIFQLMNDSLNIEFVTRQETDYASLTCSLTMKEHQSPVIVQLVNDKDFVYEEIKISGDTSISFSFLSPGFYRLKFIKDANENGRWDSGNYLKRIQPEYVYYYPEPIQIRSNWDVDVKWLVP